MQNSTQLYFLLLQNKSIPLPNTWNDVINTIKNCTFILYFISLFDGSVVTRLACKTVPWSQMFLLSYEKFNLLPVDTYAFQKKSLSVCSKYHWTIIKTLLIFYVIKNIVFFNNRLWNTILLKTPAKYFNYSETSASIFYGLFSTFFLKKCINSTCTLLRLFKRIQLAF